LLFTLVALRGAAQKHAPSPEASSLQEASPEVLPWPAPEGDVLVNLPTDQALRKNFLEFLVTHRGHSSVKGSNARSLYSLSSQTVDFGFAYSPIEHAQVSIFRSENQDDYELSVKYAFRPGGKASVFGAALAWAVTTAAIPSSS